MVLGVPYYDVLVYVLKKVGSFKVQDSMPAEVPWRSWCLCRAFGLAPKLGFRVRFGSGFRV